MSSDIQRLNSIRIDIIYVCCTTGDCRELQCLQKCHQILGIGLMQRKILH